MLSFLSFTVICMANLTITIRFPIQSHRHYILHKINVLSWKISTCTLSLVIIFKLLYTTSICKVSTAFLSVVLIHNAICQVYFADFLSCFIVPPIQDEPTSSSLKCWISWPRRDYRPAREEIFERPPRGHNSKAFENRGRGSSLFACLSVAGCVWSCLGVNCACRRVSCAWERYNCTEGGRDVPAGWTVVLGKGDLVVGRKVCVWGGDG